jgi:hypothetical protein
LLTTVKLANVFAQPVSPGVRRERPALLFPAVVPQTTNAETALLSMLELAGAL